MCQHSRPERGRRIATQLLVLTIPAVVAVTALTAWALHERNAAGLQAKLTQRARSLHTQIMADRQYYASVIVPRIAQLGGTLGSDYRQAHARFPLPATFVREVSEFTAKVSENYGVNLISPWPINKDQGPKDQFQRDAFAYLREYPRGEFFRTDTIEGRTVMRFLMADPATSQSCVDCHNAHPRSPRHDFKLNDLMGGLEIVIPMDQHLHENRQNLLMTLAGGAGLCALVVGIVVLGTRRTVTRPLDALADRMWSLAGTGNGTPGQAVPAPRENEVASLIRVFEHMQAAIAKQQTQLKDAKVSLAQRVLERTQSLQSLVEAIQGLAAETNEERLFQSLVEIARRLTGARYSALGVFDETGTRLTQFITSGMDGASRQAIGDLPSGRGLLEHMAHAEGVLRLKDLRQHPASVGFPLHHPMMRSFLSVSIRAHDQLIGPLYITEKQGPGQEVTEFTEMDEQVITGLATYAGEAIRNVRLLGEVQAAEEQYRAAMAALPVAMARLGKGGTIQLANRAFFNLLDREPKDTLGQPISALLPIEGLEEFLGTGRESRGEVSEREWEHPLPAGERRVLRLTASGIRRADDDLALVIEDITERKQLEDARLARVSSERANKAKSEFLSRMSHELRTPLNAVLGFGQLLEMDQLSPEQQEHVQHILKGGRHLLTLVNEVLDIARIEAGRMTFSLEPVPVAAVIRDAADLVHPQAAARKIQLVTPSEGGEPAYVRADRQRLKQVLLNLLSNGVKYNKEGGTLTVSCQTVPEGRYRITVTDTGGGIPAALLSRLFTPFDRLEADGATEGTGLGLVVSRGLVTVMGGTLSVNSEVGRGTSASVELLLSEPPTAGPHAAPDRIEITAPVHNGAFTVLYIEDNLSNYRLVERLVEKRPGIRLLSAMQGKLGVELAASHHPNLILLDLNLPDIQGDEVLLRLRERPETSAIPVVMLSADAMPKQIDKLLAAGARGYLTKPIEVAQFYALLDDLMAKKEGNNHE
jgi:PAS domain S-box-containing protein